MQRSSVGCSLAHRKIYAPGGPSLGLEGDILFLEIVYFLFGGEAKLRRAGYIIFFRVPSSSIRVRRSSEVYSVAQKYAA